MRPSANIIKIYWQAMDKDGRAFLHNERPLLKHGCFQCTENGDCTSVILFPIPLKPLQIAEIKVNENGNWSYEIEREEGWYTVRSKETAGMTIWQYKLSKWHYRDGNKVDTDFNYHDVNISPTRIPDECII